MTAYWPSYTLQIESAAAQCRVTMATTIDGVVYEAAYDVPSMDRSSSVPLFPDVVMYLADDVMQQVGAQGDLPDGVWVCAGMTARGDVAWMLPEDRAWLAQYGWVGQG